MANNIKILRKEKGFSQEELADRAKVSRVNLTNIENGKVIPNLDTSKKIADALNKTVDQIFFGQAVTQEIQIKGTR